MVTIYKYTNLITNKVYIGQTCLTLHQRAKCGGKGYIHCKHFYSSIQKYGWNNFICEILEVVNENIADDKEKYYIDLYNSTDPEKGYNLDFGGHIEKSRSQQTKRKISESGLGIKNSRARNVCVNGIPTNKTIRDYSKFLNISESTLRNWCQKHKFGYSYL